MTSGKRRTRKEIEEIVGRFKYTLLDEYMERNFRRVVVLDSYGYKYDIRLCHITDGHIPDFVAKGNLFSLLNISLWLKKEKKSFVLCEDNVYKGSGEKLFFQCSRKDCQETFDASWENIYNGQECPFCAGQRIGKKNNLKHRRPDLSKEWDYERNKDNPENHTEFSTKDASWICSECNYRWNSKIHNRSKGRGCPKCNQSKGEKKILIFLDNRKVDNVLQYRFKNCRDKYPLPFDFYLSKYNLCIEYHGKQHYEPVEFFGGMNSFKKQKENDYKKEKYCLDNNIKLLIIPYWEFDNIEKILEQTLFG